MRAGSAVRVPLERRWAGLRFSLVGDGMYTLPTGKKDHIVPLSGRAAAMGERGARGEWKGTCLT